MLENQLFEIVKKKYINHSERLKHVEGVYNLAKTLGEYYKIDYKKICYSSILHDICKYDTVEEQIKLINDNDIINKYPKELYHAFAGANYCKNILNISDNEVIDAIRYHTFGRKNMTRLEEIIMISDFSEENRKYLGATIVRNILLEEKNIEKAILSYYEDNIKYLESKNIKVLDEQYELRDIYKEKVCLKK